MKKILTGLISFGFLTNISANFSDLSFGTGLINQHIGQIQTDAGGSKNSFDHRVFVETDLTYKLDDRWSLIGQAGLVWPGAAENDYVDKYNYFLTAHAGYSQWENFLLRAGVGAYFTYITGDGGTVELQNGTSTSSFYVPENQTTAINTVASVAGQYFFRNDVSLKFETMVFNLTNSENRSFTYTLAIRYHFGDSLWAD